MPIFTRRRLQKMLDELAPHLTDEKGRDLLKRLDSKDVAQALPGEMELALMWALSGLGEFEIEPEWWGDSRRPDVYSEGLIPGVPAAIEIASPNDNSISGVKDMDNVARQLSECADRASKGVGRYMYYRFSEESGYDGGIYYRRRLATPGYRLSKEAEENVLQWVRSGACDHQRLHIVEPGLDVEIERKAYKQVRYHNVWSSMPPETHSLEGNPLFELLERKRRQLKAAQPGTRRMIFVADVGSALLNRLGSVGEFDPTRRRMSGQEIISHFVSKRASDIDAVVTFSPKRQRSLMGIEDIQWSVGVFNRPGLDGISPALQQVADALPSPRFEGYQARSIFNQGMFSPKVRGWYLGGVIEGGQPIGEHRLKVPARAVLDLLAGRITPEQFRYFTGEREGQKNIIQVWLDLGMTFSKIEMAPRDVDEEDDYIIIYFEDDPAARELRLKRARQKQ